MDSHEINSGAWNAKIGYDELWYHSNGRNSWHARLDFSINGIQGFLDALIEDVNIFIS